MIENGRIKVLHVHTLPVVSGSGINTLLTMAGLDKERFEVEFACRPGGSLIDKVNEQGIVFRPIKDFVQPIRPYHDLMALLELVMLIRENKYDIVHTHNSKAGFIGRLAAKIAGTPIIIHTIHGFAFHDFEKPWRRRLFIALERWAASFSDKLIVISDPLKSWGLSLKIGKPGQYVTIYSGIDIKSFQIACDVQKKKRELGIAPDEPVVGMVAKLWPGKGYDTAVYAAQKVVAEMPGTRFIFVGEGSLRGELGKMVKELGLEKQVVFTGFRTDVAEITATFDVAILPSLFEGMGRSILEAMACAKPVIASRVGGIPDLIDHGITGILIQPNNAEALSTAILGLLKDQALRLKMGQAGREKISAKFSCQTMVSKIGDVYQELLALNHGTK